MSYEKHLTHPIYAYVRRAADELGYDAYVVGGVVRDIITSLLSGVLGTGLPGLGPEHLPGAPCSESS